MPVTVSPLDLEPFAANMPTGRAAALIEGVLARATLLAPCLASDDFAYQAAAKSILIQVIARWHASGSGAITSETQGPFSVTRAPVRELFWPSEISELQALCRASTGLATGSTARPKFAMDAAAGPVDPARASRWAPTEQLKP